MSEKNKIAIKWGLSGALLYSIIGLVYYILGWSSSTFSSFISYAILIFIIIASGYEFRDKVLGGKAKFGQLLTFSLIVTFIFGTCAATWEVINHQKLDTNYYQQQIDQSTEKLEELGLSKEEIMVAVAASEKYIKNPYIELVTAYLGYLFIGLLIGLLSSSVLRSKTDTNITSVNPQSE